jgi:hypothetical protein
MHLVKKGPTKIVAEIGRSYDAPSHTLVCTEDSADLENRKRAMKMKSRRTVRRPDAEPVTASFSDTEWRAFQVMHDRYLEDRDQYGTVERARLHFMRWLYRQGRIEP